MSRKSRQRKQPKRERRAASPTQLFSPKQGSSPAQRAVVERIARGGGRYLQDNFIRIMQNSHILRDEPEFRDLYFDFQKTEEVSSRVTAKHEKQLQEMATKDKDEQEEFYDDLRIEIIDELATPAFRRDVLRRLEMLAERLTSSKQADKFEMALLLQPVLQEREIPWGLCGLVTSIYESSAEKAFGQFVHDLGPLEEILKEVEEEGNLEELLTRPEESPEVLNRVRRIKNKPGLMEQLEGEADQAFQEMERAILNANLKLDLFTEEGLGAGVAALSEHLSANQINADTADREKVAKQVAELIRGSIAQVMTKQRIKDMKSDLTQIASEWLQEKKRQAALLHAEISYLDSEEPSENPFLFAAYLGQMPRMHQGMSDSSVTPEHLSKAETPEQRPSETNASPRPDRKIATRIKSLFRR